MGGKAGPRFKLLARNEEEDNRKEDQETKRDQRKNDASNNRDFADCAN